MQALRELIVSSLDNDKAEAIAIVDLKGKTAFADHMVIADGHSTRHVSAMAEKLAGTLKELGLSHLSLEGLESCDWVLLDAGEVVVHLFRPGMREVYNLERMWEVAPLDSSGCTVI